MKDKREKSGQTPADAAAMRKQAEGLALNMEPTVLSAQTPEEIQRVLHELRVHQIELEMQNEELRTAQAQIEAGRARYYDLYDLAPVGYCTLSEKGLILEANRTAATLLGTARGALVKQPISRFIPKDDQDIYYLLRKKLFETHSTGSGQAGEPQECELRLVQPDGAIIWAHLTGTAAQEEDGAPSCCVVFSDITDRKQADEAMRASEEKFRSIFSSMTEIVVLHELMCDEEDRPVNYRILDCNPAFSRIIGIRREDAVGRLATDVYDSDSAPYLDEYARVALTGEPCTFITAYAPIDRHFDFDIHVTSPGKNMFVTVTTDITERKQAETYREMGQEILQILNEPGDLQKSIQRALAALKTWTGVDAVGLRLQEGEDFPYFVQDGFSRDFLLTENTLLERGKDGGVCRDKNDNVCLECTCGLVISGKTDPSKPLFTKRGSSWTNDSLTVLNLPPDQDPRLHPRNNCIHQGYASVALIPIRTSDRIVGLIQLNDKRKGRFTLETIEILEGIAAHIGSALMRKQAEEEIQKQLSENMRLKSESDAAREEAEEASRAKSAFLSSMSHELRTPLNAILGFSQLLCIDEELSAQQQDFAGEIVSAGKHLLSLINEVLDLARIESGRVDLSIEPVSCAVVLSESAKMIGPFADKHGIRLEIGKADGLSVQADAVRFKQVLVNLLSNAIKYNKPGGLVTVVCSRRDDTVRISVTDCLGNGFRVPGR